MVRKFVARRLVNLLLQHGDLEAQIRDIRLRQDEELSAVSYRRDSGQAASHAFAGRSSPVPVAAFGVSDDDDAIAVLHHGWGAGTASEIDGVEFLALLPHVPHVRVGNAFGRVERAHSALILAAAAVIARHLRAKRRRVAQSWIGGRRSWNRHVDAASLLLARISFCLMALLLAVHSAPCSEFASFASLSSAAAKLLDGELRRVAWNRLVFRSSLWALLISVAPGISSAIWAILNPASHSSASSFFLRFHSCSNSKWTRLVHLGEVAAILGSFASVCFLAYLDLPLFRSFLDGSLLPQLGFPHSSIQFLYQLASSFIAYCLFAKLIPPTASANATDHPPPPPKKSTGRFGNANPAVVQRMATLAQEARARVEQRKKIMAEEGGSAASRMSRSYSVATFNPAKYHEEEPIVCSKHRSIHRSNTIGIDRSPIQCPSSVGGASGKTLDRRRMSENNNYSYRTPTSSPLLPRKVSERNGVNASHLLVPTPPFAERSEIGKMSTPIRRRLRPSLTSLPERPCHDTVIEKKNNGECDKDTKQSCGTTITNVTCKPSPLLDIHQAGPSHSSKDVFAKLEKHKSLRRRKNSRKSDVPRSLYIPYPEEEGKYADETASSTGGEEDEGVHEHEEKQERLALLDLDEGYDRVLALPLMVGSTSSSSSHPSSPAHNKDMELAFLKSNPQSANTTPVPEHDYLV